MFAGSEPHIDASAAHEVTHVLKTEHAGEAGEHGERVDPDHVALDLAESILGASDEAGDRRLCTPGLRPVVPDPLPSGHTCWVDHGFPLMGVSTQRSAYDRALSALSASKSGTGPDRSPLSMSRGLGSHETVREAAVRTVTAAHCRYLEKSRLHNACRPRQLLRERTQLSMRDEHCAPRSGQDLHQQIRQVVGEGPEPQARSFGPSGEGARALARAPGRS